MGITRKTLKEAGVRPLVQGVLLWMAAGSTSPLPILKGWIHL